MADSTTVRLAVEGTWRAESARVIGRIARLVGDVGLAEDIVHDTLVAALERWPSVGVPANPGAWLTAAAKQRAIDLLRRQDRLADKYAEVGRALARAPDLSHLELDRVVDDRVDDDVLGLMLLACHPVLTPDAQVALTLKVVAGLSTGEIARAYLVPEATAAQRIVRAKRTLSASGARFEVPSRQEVETRLEPVLDVLLLVYNEGYTATSGDDWMRPALCDEAIRLATTLADLVPDAPEVHGLLALMHLQSSRQTARTDPDGEPVLLLDQDRAQWDGARIAAGLAALERAERLGPPGPLTLQAAIAACHARAADVADTDWARMAELYRTLCTIDPSPVAELNRAVAVSHAGGPDAALPLVEALLDEPLLRSYAWLPAVHADLLERVGRRAEAHDAFLRAAQLTANGRDHDLLIRRARACAQ
jgi:RNA polymerase sigma factor (sigma-70 family)